MPRALIRKISDRREIVECRERGDGFINETRGLVGGCQRIEDLFQKLER